MDAIVFCGIQGAGKSTFFAQRFVHSHVRLNLDMLNTRNRENILLHACLAAQQPFVADNTNPEARQRLRYLQLARAAGFRATLYFFRTSVEDAIRRNAARPEDRRVPEVAIRGTAAKLQNPTLDEGWDEAYVVHTLPDLNFQVEALP